MQHYDVVIIGGGPAGMAAALSASETGASTLIVDRDEKLGGILNQCVHNGFGMKYFQRQLTGPEYANLSAQKIAEANVEVLLNSFVTGITADKILTVLSHGKGMLQIQAKAVVFATGCRERTAGALALAGDRPAGVWTAGVAQHLANIDGCLLGKEIVILGSGDIGLITARHMTLAGANVKLVCEIMPCSPGLESNLKHCLHDFNIPLMLSTTVTRVVGKPRIQGVYIADVDEKRRPKIETERFVECDCLLLSVGLMPENELAEPILEMCGVTHGAVVDEHRQASIQGFFACGNALHVHDLVDNVSEEAHIAGHYAGLYSLGKLPQTKQVATKVGSGIRYVLPQKLNLDNGNATLYFRPSDICQKATVIAECGGRQIASHCFETLTPGKMDTLTIDKNAVDSDVIIYIQEENR